MLTFPKNRNRDKAADVNESEDAVLEELNDRQRRFVELVVLGRAAGRDYEEAGYDARGEVADQAASRLL